MIAVLLFAGFALSQLKIDSPLAKMKCEDCITEVAKNKDAYLAIIKSQELADQAAAICQKQQDRESREKCLSAMGRAINSLKSKLIEAPADEFCQVMGSCRPKAKAK